MYAREVIPGFAAHGSAAAARAYAAETMDRFANPFLDHRIAAIAQNHALKVDRRIGAFLAWAAEAGQPVATPALDAVMHRNPAPATREEIQ